MPSPEIETLGPQLRGLGQLASGCGAHVGLALAVDVVIPRHLGFRHTANQVHGSHDTFCCCQRYKGPAIGHQISLRNQRGCCRQIRHHAGHCVAELHAHSQDRDLVALVDGVEFIQGNGHLADRHIGDFFHAQEGGFTFLAQEGFHQPHGAVLGQAVLAQAVDHVLGQQGMVNRSVGIALSDFLGLGVRDDVGKCRQGCPGLADHQRKGFLVGGRVGRRRQHVAGSDQDCRSCRCDGTANQALAKGGGGLQVRVHHWCFLVESTPLRRYDGLRGKGRQAHQVPILTDGSDSMYKPASNPNTHYK